MKIYGVVSIDTECDRGYTWRNILPVKYSSVHHSIPQQFEPIFKKHGVKPTYLLSPEVIADQHSVDLLKSLTHVELGTHLHGEFVGRNPRAFGDFQDEYQAMYSPSEEEEKLMHLTQMFGQAFGYAPRSFRAGRWGISPQTGGILAKLGYWVDSSVTPYFNWRFPDYELDYKIIDDQPYFMTDRESSLNLLQVPVTIYSAYGFWLNANRKRFPQTVVSLLKALPLWRPVWLRPTYSHFDKMKDVIDAHLNAHKSQDEVVLNMMFHNVEILSPENPYGFSDERIKLFLEDMARVFDYMNSLNVHFVGLSELHPIFSKYRGA